MILASSCKKERGGGIQKVARAVRFQLYTDQDFSEDNHTITFQAFIQSSNNTDLWDSMFPPMKISEIPGVANKLGMEKTVLANAAAVLKVGFRYSIQDVGLSWFIDTSSAGQLFKLVDFNFREKVIIAEPRKNIITSQSVTKKRSQCSFLYF